jgi:hypothetical protein
LRPPTSRLNGFSMTRPRTAERVNVS